MSTGSPASRVVPDSALFTSLLRPVTDRIEAGAIGGPAAAWAVFRAGLLLMKFGQWLLDREGQSYRWDWEWPSLKADHDALAERVLSQETGAPFPPIEEP